MLREVIHTEHPFVPDIGALESLLALGPDSDGISPADAHGRYMLRQVINFADLIHRDRCFYDSPYEDEVAHLNALIEDFVLGDECYRVLARAVLAAAEVSLGRRTASDAVLTLAAVSVEHA